MVTATGQRSGSFKQTLANIRETIRSKTIPKSEKTTVITTASGKRVLVPAGTTAESFARSGGSGGRGGSWMSKNMSSMGVKLAQEAARKAAVTKAARIRVAQETAKREAERKRLAELERMSRDAKRNLSRQQAYEMQKLRSKTRQIAIKGWGTLPTSQRKELLDEARVRDLEKQHGKNIKLSKRFEEARRRIRKVGEKKIKIEEKIQPEETFTTPINIFSRKTWREFGTALRKSKNQKDRSLGKKILTEPLLFVSQFIRRTLEVQELPAGLVALIKKPENIKEVPAGILEDVKGTINLIKTSPSEGLARVGADIFTFKIIGRSLKVTGKVTKAGATKLFPSRLGVKVSPLGVRIIRKIKKVGQIEIIPPRGTKLKVKQLGMGKKGKVLRDIELISGKKESLNRAAIKGAYGFSEKELNKFIGKRGAITTAQQDLFKSLRARLKGSKSFDPKEIIKTQAELVNKKIFTPKELKLKKWLYATPADPKTGVAQVRVSRLGLSSGQEASLRDLLRGQASFKKGKSAIYVFPDEKIFKSPGRLTKGVAKPTPKGFVVPLFSQELEVVLGKGWIIKKGKRLATRLIDGDKVGIFELKKIKIPKVINQDLKKLAVLNKKLSVKGFKRSSKAGKELVKKIDTKEKLLNTKLKKTTGFDYFSKAKPTKKVFPIKRKISAAAIRKISRKIPKRKPISRVIPIKRIPSKPTRRPSIPRRVPTKPSRKPSRPLRISKPISKTTRRISRPIKRKTGTPAPKKIILPGEKKKKIKVRPSAPQGYNVYGKYKGKFMKLNRVPLSKTKAFDRGAFAIDKSTANTFKVEGVKKVKKLGKLTKGEVGHFSKTKRKYRSYRIQKGKRITLKDKKIEKRGKPRIDTRGEKSGLTLAKFAKQRGFIGTRTPTKRTSVSRKTIRRTPIRKPKPKKRQLSPAQLKALSNGRKIRQQNLRSKK